MNGKLYSVNTADMVPRQHKTSIGIKRSTDCYQRYMLKFNELAVFHSRAELYHAVLLEADPLVSNYVPQPFNLRLGSGQYVPDCFFIREGKRFVRELRPKAKYDERKLNSLKAYFERFNMTFEVISNESILCQERLAENWITIISHLYSTQSLTTDSQEIDLLSRFGHSITMCLSDILDPGNRLKYALEETALFRLLHRGLIKATLTESVLDYDTEFSLCI